MKAVVYHRYGGPEVLELVDVAPPKMHVGSVLVRVHAAGVKPADLMMRAGHGDATVPTYLDVEHSTFQLEPVGHAGHESGAHA
jgi:NADPH:quinone reductase-like Zn-dependent oxidoreductase